VADQVLASMPTARTVARENRKFLGRAVRFLVAEAGVRQFLDIGVGLPTTENVHEVAQRTDPTARVVYADNDPLALVHARVRCRPGVTSPPRNSHPSRVSEGSQIRVYRIINRFDPVAIARWKCLAGPVAEIEAPREAVNGSNDR
jgi:hypothetical protein